MKDAKFLITLVGLDIVVIGGGPAGLSAALVLGRAGSGVLVCEGGQGGNFSSPASHGLLTRDGASPEELKRLGRAEVERYPSVQFTEARVTQVRVESGALHVTLDSGRSVVARKVILAMGLHDVLPDILGLKSCWGKSVFRCPYCHAWEYRDKAIGILAKNERAVELASLMSSWSRKLTILTSGPAEFEARQRLLLQKNRVQIRESPLSRLDEEGGQLRKVHFADGSSIDLDAMVICAPQHRDPELVTQLGLVENGELKVLPTGQTKNPNVYVAGDFGNQHQPQFIVSALYSGAFVAQNVHRALAQEDFLAALKS